MVGLYINDYERFRLAAANKRIGMSRIMYDTTVMRFVDDVASHESSTVNRFQRSLQNYANKSSTPILVTWF